jgi:general secretion pathway protein K
MRRAAPSRTSRRGSGGFALIIVLWTLVLIAFITAHLVATGRTEIHIAGNLADNAGAGAAADGAISQTIFDLLAPDRRQRRRLDGAAHTLEIGDCRVTVRVYDEAGRINPNLASPALLEALLRVTGTAPENARRLAVAIDEWVGASGAARTQAALTAEYRAAGRDYAPLAEPLETIGELRRVLGMTPTLFAAIAPHLSLFAPAVPILQDADPIVRAAVAAITKSDPGQLAATPAQPDDFTARIQAIAQGPGNARAARLAIVRILPASGRYTTLAWGDDARMQ